MEKFPAASEITAGLVADTGCRNKNSVSLPVVSFMPYTRDRLTLELLNAGIFVQQHQLVLSPDARRMLGNKFFRQFKIKVFRQHGFVREYQDVHMPYL